MGKVTYCTDREPDDVKRTLRNRRGNFTPEQLYERIPVPIKTSAKATEEFLGSRDLSHIKLVKNAPGRESDIANVLFEKVKWNRARGAADMTVHELMRARLDNFAESIVPALKATGTTGLQGALIGALLELPVATAENFILVRGEGRTWQDALQDVAKKAGKGAIYGSGAGTVYAGIVMLGVPVEAVAAPLAIIGGTMYIWSAKERVWQAIDKVNADLAVAEKSSGTETLGSSAIWQRLGLVVVNR
ncbi:MAG: hypothetical protein F4Z73_04940 [Synechococcus sp. SB0668_bin_13]|nr:hypothetical protein [Synechococcus sp. SB0668_bin_13]MXX09711.1 hypothetical protein [Synechococcus sp. SB0667_bin_8]MYG63235.1 hypothetical protein [Synechococcus sp. SB0675_bin_7]MYK86709.1 hypothetical protein [Synechococcus sp. SB0669_bin_7]